MLLWNAVENFIKLCKESINVCYIVSHVFVYLLFNTAEFIPTGKKNLFRILDLFLNEHIYSQLRALLPLPLHLCPICKKKFFSSSRATFQCVKLVVSV